MRSRHTRAYFDSARAAVELDDYRRIVRVVRVVANIAIIAAIAAFAFRFEHPGFVVGGISILGTVIVIHNTVRPKASVFEMLTLDTMMYLTMTVVVDAPALPVFVAMAQTLMVFHFVPPRRAIATAVLFLCGGLVACAASLFIENQQRSAADTLLLLSIVTVITSAPALWAQIRADCAGLPVQIPKERDTSPLGAAICAAVAGGLQPDIATCADLVGAIAETIVPDPTTRAAYDDAYLAYHKLFDCLCPLFEGPDKEPGDA